MRGDPLPGSGFALRAGALASLLLAAAQPTAASAHGAADYLALARRYRTGDTAGPVAEMRLWLSAEIERANAELRSDEKAHGGHPDDFRDAEAAIVLHAHVGLQALLSRSPVMAGFHLTAADRLFQWIREVAQKRRNERPEAVTREGSLPAERPLIVPRIGERDFYLAMTGGCLGVWGLPVAASFAEAGLRRLPTDAEMLLLAASVQEALATEQANLGRGGEARRALERAEKLLRGTLAVDERNLEALLRLGHVQLIQERFVEAELPLLTVAREASGGSLGYLSWLFLAALRDARQDLAGAAEAYERAVAVQPDGQAASLGLAWVRDRQSGPGEAHRVLKRYLGRPHHAERAPDPWAGYIFGPRALTDPGAALGRLRSRVVAP